ncbi:MAG: YjbQ family protein [Actinomycetota bacterium]|nr:YjbQ family protein [Actinomycetota bacterium]
MTSVEIPVSIAAALPSLTVFDITNEISHEISRTGGSGIAYVSPNGDPSLIRVQEREKGFFEDLEGLLGRLVPLDAAERTRLVSLLLGPRTEQIPYTEGHLCLGTYQRIFLVGFDEDCRDEWTLTLLG